MNILAFAISLVVGFLLIKYSKWIDDTFSVRFVTVEKVLGAGGMLTFWKLIGLVLVVLSFYILFGNVF